MPSGIYIRTEKAKQACRDNFKKASGIASKLPRSKKQLEVQALARKKAQSLPKTAKQLEAIKENQKKAAEHNLSGEFTMRMGYVFKYCPGHPHAVRNCRVPYHRWLVEQEIGRVLLPNEEVHHENKIRNDNRLRNLIAFASKSAHIRWHKNPENVNSGEIIFDGRTYEVNNA